MMPKDSLKGKRMKACSCQAWSSALLTTSSCSMLLTFGEVGITTPHLSMLLYHLAVRDLQNWPKIVGLASGWAGSLVPKLPLSTLGVSGRGGSLCLSLTSFTNSHTEARSGKSLALCLPWGLVFLIWPPCFV